jgi:hypothetical protein
MKGGGKTQLRYVTEKLVFFSLAEGIGRGLV